MKAEKSVWHKLLTAIVVTVTLLPTGGWSMAPVPQGATVETTSSETIKSKGTVEVLYRTRVSFPNITARDRLDRLGVVVLEEGADGALGAFMEVDD
jgi:hypothetical protein